MKKLSRVFICLLGAVVFSIGLASCNNILSNSSIDTSGDTSNSSEDTSSSSSTSTNGKLDYDMSNIKFEDKTVTYDGNEHTLEITGTLPEGVSVSYTNNKLTEVGSIEATATFMGDYENYNEIPDMTATLTIVPFSQDSEGNYIINGIIYEDVGETMYVVGYTDDINQDAFIVHEIFGKPVTSIGYRAFSGCRSLTSITIHDSVTSIGEYAFSGCSSLTSITIPNSVTSIGYNAFEDCSSLTSITIPNSVTRIGDDAFSRCTGLTSITIPNSVTRIGYNAFLSCSSLISIKVDEDNRAYDSRDNCNAIIETRTNKLITGCKSTIIPNSVTSIGDNAFYECSSLTSITIPNSVTSIGDDAFSRCTGLTSIIIPYSVTSIGDGAFRYCSSLTSITIPDNVASISNYAFEKCSSLTSITIGNSVASIGNYAFSGCSSLTSITIPNSVTSIGDDAFSRCTGLTSITIPNSLTSIGDRAFEDCSSLIDVYYSGTQKQWNRISIGSGNYFLICATIHFNYEI